MGALEAATEALKEEQQDAEARGEKLPKDDKVNFIHLREAKFFTPGHLPIPSEQTGTFWRGKIAAVDGFQIGELRVGRPGNV